MAQNLLNKSIGNGIGNHRKRYWQSTQQHKKLN